MDNKELLIIAEAVSKEKNISKDDVLNSLAEGIETALRKDFPEGAIVSVSIDPKTGEVKAYRVFEIVEHITEVEAEMLQEEIEDEIVEDGFAYEPFEFVMNRQKFNITKQVALQKIKQNSREQQIEELLNQPIALFSGVVKVSRKDQLIVDCKGLDISIPRRNLLPRENFRVSDTINFTLTKEKNQYVGTRVNDDYLIETLKREVFEIGNGDIEIVSVARNPGYISKVVLKSNVRNLDPIKSAIGHRGSYIKSIQNLLGGEYISFIPNQEDDVQLLIKALHPISIVSIIIDEDLHSMDIAVADEDIQKAVGRNNQNVDMISKLVGWTVNIYPKSEWDTKNNIDEEKTLAMFEQALNCDTQIAQILWENGFSSLEEIAYIPVHEFEIEEFDEDTVLAIKQAAKDSLNNSNELILVHGVAELVELGFSKEERQLLQENSIFDNSNIADLSTWELTDIISNLEPEQAQKVIMKAREKDTRFQE